MRSCASNLVGALDDDPKITTVVRRVGKPCSAVSWISIFILVKTEQPTHAYLIHRISPLEHVLQVRMEIMPVEPSRVATIHDTHPRAEAQEPAELVLDLDSDETLPVYPLRREVATDDETCEACQ